MTLEVKDTSTGTPIWLSPDRDVSVMIPLYIRRAVDLLRRAYDEDDGARAPDVGIEDCQAYVAKIQAFILDCDKGFNTPSLEKSFQQLGLLTQPKAEAALGKYVLRVLLCAYYKGLRERQRGERGDPVTISTLTSMTDTLAEFTAGEAV